MAWHVPVLRWNDHCDQGLMTTVTVSEDQILNAVENEAIAILRETAAAFKKLVLPFVSRKPSYQAGLPVSLPERGQSMGIRRDHRSP